MTFEIRYHADVKSDIAVLNESIKRRIKTAIEKRLVVSPHQYGKPLRKTLKGYWKMRVGDYRVVFKIVKDEVRVFGIIHRKDVYKEVEKRILN